MRAFLVPASLVLAAVAPAQTTWYVDLSGTPPGSGTQADPYTSIQYAIDQPTTEHLDTIVVAPGTYGEALDMSSSSKQLRVVSSGGPLVTLLAPSSAPVAVWFAGYGQDATKTHLEGFTVQGHPAMKRGVSGTGTLERCIVRDVTGGSGFSDSALFTDYDLIVEECTIVANRLGLQGGALDGIFYVRNSIVHGNTFFDLSPALDSFGSHVAYTTWGTGLEPSSSSAGNLKGDPGLWNPDQGDLHLAFGSTSIDSGDPTSPLDPDGSTIDRGALTFDAGYLPPIEVYCTAKTNSQGCGASIGASGGLAASASAPIAFDIGASGVVSNTIGLLFYGFGRREAPFMGGLHCVEPPTPRVGAQLSGGAAACSGAFLYDFNQRVQSGLDPALQPGTMVHAQWWYRDPADPLGFGAATSDAIEFPIQP